MNTPVNVRCNETSRTCFAQRRKTRNGHWNCNLLNGNYPDGECPFCKPVAEITNNVMYPYNPLRGLYK